MARRKTRRPSTGVSWWHDIKRDWAKLKRWNAKRHRVNNETRKITREAAAVRQRELLQRDRDRAAKAAERDRKAKERRDRMAAAQARRVGAPTPTTRPAPTAGGVKQRRSTAAEVLTHSRPCGARTQDGTPCEHPVVGDQCAAGHKPSTRARRTTGTTQQPGESNGRFLQRATRADAGERYERMRAQADASRGVQCRCCGMHHGHDRQQPGHCDWCKGHARARAGSSA
jgi:hypothetical protein